MGFCSSNQGQQTQNANQYIDPLGQNASGGYTPSGAPELRTQLFNYLGGSMPQANSAGADYAAALKTAASNPAWQTVAANAGQTASGAYLNGSPALDRAMATNRATTLADAANQNARIRSQFAQNGMGFSTGNEQAEQANNAAANASAANTSAQTYLQNYLTERGNQNNAGAQLQQATSGPLSYLAQVPGAYSSGLTTPAQLLSGLASGGQVVQTGSNTTGTTNPSLGGSILAGVQSL